MNYLNINLGAFGIIATILAIAATVVAFVMIVPESKREKLGRFGKFLHAAVNFKFLIVEKILQALYIFVTAYLILCGFFMLFMAPETWTGRHWLGGYGILLMVLGPIAVRLCYELLMMAVLLLKNVISINRKLKNQNERSADADLFAVPELHRTQPSQPTAPVTPVAPAAPAQRSTPFQPAEQAAPAAPSFCTRCGAHLDENGHCPNLQPRCGMETGTLPQNHLAVSATGGYSEVVSKERRQKPMVSAPPLLRASPGGGRHGTPSLHCAQFSMEFV